MRTFVLKRKEFYWLEKIYTDLVVVILPFVGQTFLTPNIITIFNMINSVIACGMVWLGKPMIAAVLVQLYLFLDILDGNLARYQNSTSALGKVLDQISDRLFYNLFYVILSLKLRINWGWILLYLLVHNGYGIIATFIIVPSIKKLSTYRRWGLKKRLMERGIILGMDLSTQCIITSMLLLTPYKEKIIYLITVLYLLDLVYRLIELWLNIKFNSKK